MTRQIKRYTKEEKDSLAKRLLPPESVSLGSLAHTSFYTLKEAIQDEIDKMIEWIDNQEGNIAVLRLAGFWL